MTPTRRATVLALFALLATVTLLAGCTSGAAGDKSGGPPESAELILADNDDGLVGVPAVARFIDRVHELSGGNVTIRVQAPWKGGDDEPRLIRDVAAGKADLGWSGTRAFDQVGVDAFRPLHAPFLVSSLAAEAAVIGDPLSGQLLASLRPKGLVGLALVADEMRHPVGVGGPLLAPADFRGVTFETFASGAQADGIAALGAQPTAQPVRLANASGHLGGFETMWGTYQVQGYAAVAPYVSANVDLWPRSYVIFANAQALGRLDPQVRDWISRAASEASTWSTTHALDAQDAQVAAACQHNARIALATPHQLAQLRAAAEPVYRRLRADPAQRPTLERIEELVASAQADPPITVPTGCAYEPGEERLRPPVERLLSGPGSPGALPQGVYRYSHSLDDLKAHGLDDHDAWLNAGVITWTLRGGRWHLHQDAVDPSVPMTTCDGFYDVQADQVAFTTTSIYSYGECMPKTWTARWAVHGDTLVWSAVGVDSDFAYEWAPRPWRRIG